MATVSWDDLETAFLFVSSDDGGMNKADVCKKTGKIYWRSDLIDPDDLEDLPEDLDESDQYLSIPTKRDLDLGKPLALAFAREHMPDDYDEVRWLFSRSGAYGGFKRLLARRGALDRWYAFENEAIRAALKEWCAENGIELAA